MMLLSSEDGTGNGTVCVNLFEKKQRKMGTGDGSLSGGQGDGSLVPSDRYNVNQASA